MITSVRRPQALDPAKGFNKVLTGMFNGEGIRKGIVKGHAMAQVIVGGRYAGAAQYIMVASHTGALTVLGDHSAGGPEYTGGGTMCLSSGTVGSGSAKVGSWSGSSDGVPYAA
eukprot:CAMPEP_0168188376 /NCGR_PEP_ID=MMETSP0139_2-20121125/15605_1 /TAXON_ID=44445 /ORGANISM="Pseudo-nitzschia australis, Strain 10249 10 AB" /LENGTH=112 /DNA_ID=CAMNT_0008110791 /DNA_START=574 /DNA_END=913 /DNA_ORIENTATION=+